MCAAYQPHPPPIYLCLPHGFLFVPSSFHCTVPTRTIEEPPRRLYRKNLFPKESSFEPPRIELFRKGRRTEARDTKGESNAFRSSGFNCSRVFLWTFDRFSMFASRAKPQRGFLEKYPRGYNFAHSTFRRYSSSRRNFGSLPEARTIFKNASRASVEIVRTIAAG